MEQTVTRQRIAMVAIDLLKRDHNLWQRCTEHGERREEMAMNTHLSKRMTMVATLALLVSFSTTLRAQDASAVPAVPAPAAPDAGSAPAVAPPAAPDAGSAPAVAPQAGAAAQALTGDQQTAANSALCSAMGSSAGPSALSNPTVLTTAASAFAGSTNLPLSSATDMLKGYVAQHATDILASCATGSVTSGITSKIPGAGSLPSVPNVP
jgi:hypothetical protein